MKKDCTEWGFDTTDFDTEKNFSDFLTKNKIGRAKLSCKADTDYKGNPIKLCQFEWKGKNVKLITSNNALTGKMANYDQITDLGNAGYIGITGKPAQVEKLAKSVKKFAYTKDESKCKRGFI